MFELQYIVFLPLMLFNFEYNEIILDLFKLLISNFV